MLPIFDKVEFLINNCNAKIISQPTEFEKDLVCVAENLFFDVAAYAYDERELMRFLNPDPRRKTWLIVPNAEKLAT